MEFLNESPRFERYRHDERLRTQLLSDYRSSLQTFDQAAQTIVERIYQTFRTPQGDPIFALLRIFYLARPDHVPNAWRVSADPTDVSLSLAGSYGDEPLGAIPTNRGSTRSSCSAAKPLQ